jgi:hypothetical protein
LRRRDPQLALAALGVVLAACAPKLHTLDPYRSDGAAARVLEARACELCAEGPKGPRTLPAEPFVTDGCSLWIDDGWGEPCCVEHDISYWCGGRSNARAEADAELRRCVDARTSAAVAWLMWLGVRAGGHPIFPTWYRWGYGRSYRPWYADFPADAAGSSDAQACGP